MAVRAVVHLQDGTQPGEVFANDLQPLLVLAVEHAVLLAHQGLDAIADLAMADDPLPRGLDVDRLMSGGVHLPRLLQRNGGPHRVLDEAAALVAGHCCWWRCWRDLRRARIALWRCTARSLSPTPIYVRRLAVFPRRLCQSVRSDRTPTAICKHNALQSYVYHLCWHWDGTGMALG